MAMPISIPANRPDPCALIIFGASGDLTQRKLVPALYELYCQGNLPENLFVIGVSRTEMSDDDFRWHLGEGASRHAIGYEEGKWREFARRLHYLAGSATKAELYPKLKARTRELAEVHGLPTPGLGSTDQTWACLPNTLFYLSVAPHLVEPIVSRIGEAGMVYEGKRWCSIGEGPMPWQRIIVEKPIGTNLESAREQVRALGRVFEEESIYRIDHYLGKELVQNILVMRFANTFFEPLWNNKYVDHVQVTAAEQVGVGRRAGGFYDRAGALRDMIQSHLLQIMALVAMEPPASFDPTAIRREKIKLIDAVREVSPEDAAQFAAFGRYAGSGNSADDDGGLGYAELEGVEAEQRTETYAALKLHIDNWRWSGVPFFVRSGKKMPRKLTEVVIQFREPPVRLFNHVDPRRGEGVSHANRIVINIAPDEGMSLRLEAKVPGPSLRIKPVKMDLDYAYVFNAQPLESYGPLMLEAMRGDQTLFKHRDEVDGAWRICEPFLTSEQLRASVETYGAYSWGPSAADALIGGDGRAWHNPDAGERR